jgi:hypothetical protein
MTARRWHRLIGLLICLPCLLWSSSGAVLAWKNWARSQKPPAREPSPAPLEDKPFRVPIERALAAIGRSETPAAVEWIRLAGAPHYRVRYASPPRSVLVDGTTGELRKQEPPIPEALASSIAQGDAPPGVAVRSVVWHTAGTMVYPDRNELPVWRATLDNGDDVYVSPTTGEIHQHTDTLVRVIRVSFYGLHVWKWGSSQQSYLFLMVMSLLLSCGAMTGLWLALRPRRSR